MDMGEEIIKSCYKMKDTRYSTIGGERCHNCGKIYKMWYYISDELWEKVTGQKEGLLCPPCFDALASINGYSLNWTVKVCSLKSV